VVYWLLTINISVFFIKICIGWFAESTALIADSIDMFTDTVVYGLDLYVVGPAAKDKAKATQVSGYFRKYLAYYD